MRDNILFMDLGIDATNNDILDQMRPMKSGREDGRYGHVVCTVRGFDEDERHWFEIPEVRAFCRRVVGLPDATPHLADVNADAEIRRLDNIVRDGIKPRIPGIQIRVVEGFADGPVLRMRTPRSFAAPHMVTFQDHSRF